MAYLFWVGRRRIAKQNFAIVLSLPAGDREVARVARRSFRNFAKYLVEIMRFPRLDSEDFARLVTIDPRSWSYFRAAHDHGRGLIFVSMHFGNFEIGGARAPPEMPLHATRDAPEEPQPLDPPLADRPPQNDRAPPPPGAGRARPPAP